MNYKLFFAALAAAFFMFINAVAAQDEPKRMLRGEILDYCQGNPNKIFELVAQNRMTYSDVDYFISDEFISNNEDQFYKDILAIYWDNLPLKERYDLYNHSSLDGYTSPLLVEKGLLVLDERVKFVLENKAMIADFNPATQYDDYLRKRLLISDLAVNELVTNKKLKTTAEKKAAFQPYFNQIKEIAPQCLEYVQAYVYTRHVYTFYANTKDYFYWEDICVSNYETRPSAFDYAARQVFNFSKDKNILNLGLKWIDLGIEKGECADCLFTKAKILFLLGKKTESHQAYEQGLKAFPNTLTQKQDVYRSQIARFIGKA